MSVTTVRNKAIDIAKETAKIRRVADKKKINDAKAAELTEKRYRARLLTILNDVLDQFKTDFDILDLGDKYVTAWEINRRSGRNKVNLCTIRFGNWSRTFDGSDECRNITIQEYAVKITKGDDNLAYIKFDTEFENRFAKFMSRYY